MNKIDRIYQKAVDAETEKLMSMSVDKIEKISDYGNMISVVENCRINIGWQNLKFGDKKHHLVFMAERKFLFFFHKKYLNGIKIENGIIDTLSEVEVGSYD